MFEGGYFHPINVARRVIAYHGGVKPAIRVTAKWPETTVGREANIQDLAHNAAVLEALHEIRSRGPAHA